MHGTVKWYNEQAGYGFITVDKAPDVFVHKKDLRKTGIRVLRTGDLVEFKTKPGKRSEAAYNVHITKAVDRAQSGTLASRFQPARALVLFLMLFCGWAYAQDQEQPEITQVQWVLLDYTGAPTPCDLTVTPLTNVFMGRTNFYVGGKIQRRVTNSVVVPLLIGDYSYSFSTIPGKFTMRVYPASTIVNALNLPSPSTNLPPALTTNANPMDVPVSALRNGLMTPPMLAQLESSLQPDGDGSGLTGVLHPDDMDGILSLAAGDASSKTQAVWNVTTALVASTTNGLSGRIDAVVTTANAAVTLTQLSTASNAAVSAASVNAAAQITTAMAPLASTSYVASAVASIPSGTNQASAKYKYLAVFPENLDNGDYFHSLAFKASIDGINWVTLYNRTPNYDPNLFMGAPCIWYNSQTHTYIVATDSTYPGQLRTSGSPDAIHNAVVVTLSTNLVDWTPPIVCPLVLGDGYYPTWGVGGPEFYEEGTNHWIVFPAFNAAGDCRMYSFTVDGTGTNYGVGTNTLVLNQKEDAGRPIKIGPNKYLLYSSFGVVPQNLHAYTSTNPVSGYNLTATAINAGWFQATSVECPLIITNSVTGGYTLYMHSNPENYGYISYATSPDCTNWTFRGILPMQGNAPGRISVWPIDAAGSADVERVLANNRVHDPVEVFYKGVGQTFTTPHFASGAPSMTRVNYRVTGYSSASDDKFYADVDAWIGAKAANIPRDWYLFGTRVNKILRSSTGWSATPQINNLTGLTLGCAGPSIGTTWNVIQTSTEEMMTNAMNIGSKTMTDYTPQGAFSTGIPNVLLCTDSSGALIPVNLGTNLSFDTMTHTLSVSTNNNLLSGLVAYWRLDEAQGNNRVDLVGGANLSEVGGVITNVVGKITNAANFATTSSRILSTASTPALQYANSMSMCGWINWGGVNNSPTIFSKSPSVANNTLNEYTASISGSKFMMVIWQNGSAQTLTEPTTLVAGNWYFFAWGVDSGQLWVSINGAARTTASQTKIPILGTSPLGFGNYPEQAAGYYFGGAIDEVGIWKRKLSDAELTTLYNAGAGKTYPF